MSLAFIIGLIVLGIFFLVVEIFLIPGISLPGIAGVACMIGGVSMAYVRMGPTVGTWTLALSIIALSVVLYGFYRSKTFDKMALKTNIDSKTNPFDGLKIKVGDQGTAITRLGPIGKIQLKDTVVEGRSENELIDAGTPVEVVDVGSYNVTVRKVTSL